MNVTNPKVALLFIALLPQFIDPAGGNLLAQMLGLGAIHMAVATAVTLTLVVTARRLRESLVGSGRLQRAFPLGGGIRPVGHGRPSGAGDPGVKR